MNLTIEFPRTTRAHSTSFDFSKNCGSGIDEVVHQFHQVIYEASRNKNFASSTLIGLAWQLQSSFFPWLVEAAAAVNRELKLNDLDEHLIRRYERTLLRKHSEPTVYSRMRGLRTALKLLYDRGLISSVAEIMPSVANGNIIKHFDPKKPYSDAERKAILRGLGQDISLIRSGKFKSDYPAEPIIVYLLLMAFQSGFNASPMLTVSRTAGLRPHPIKKNTYLFVGYKARAGKEVAIAAKWSQQVEEMAAVGLEIKTLFDEVLQLTKPLLKDVQAENRDYLFLRPPMLKRSKDKSGRPVPLTLNDMAATIHKSMGPRHNIKDSEGKLVVPSLSRIRATLAERAMKLSGGDRLIVSKILNNKLATTNRHYVEPPFDSEIAFSKAMEGFRDRIRTHRAQPSVRTPVAGCSNPLHGKYAPGDGVTYCERWLQCFRCPNQCITGEADSLWRLYSFYWTILESSQRFSRLPIAGLIRFTCKLIDQVIPEEFGVVANIARDRARSERHPYWSKVASMGILEVITSDADSDEIA